MNRSLKPTVRIGILFGAWLLAGLLWSAGPALALASGPIDLDGVFTD